jgi:predicted phosphoadenosine phosphosulfate sulfurtransferase
MSALKHYLETDVLTAARERIAYAFDHLERVYVSYSGGKDSTVMLHLVCDEARRRQRTVGCLVIDLEAQYSATISHVRDMLTEYADVLDVYWCCLPIKLRNAVSNFEPVWCAWDPERQADWVREMPDVQLGRGGVISDPSFFPFFVPRMEFEEFMILFGVWYAGHVPTAAFVGIRCDESLNRFRTIASRTKEMHQGRRFTTKVTDTLYNVYPLYDWHVSDIWRYHSRYPAHAHNTVYDQMHRAGLSPHQMRLCQPYGDDQRRGLWLYQILEPQTWVKLLARVNGANSGALYVEETGNVSGYNKVTLPPGHTWQTFCKLLLSTMPDVTRTHYVERFQSFLKGWAGRGYVDGIPDEAPRCLEKKQWAPSWRRLCRVLLRNDWWCKGLGLTQPKSAAYAAYMDLMRERRGDAAA